MRVTSFAFFLFVACSLMTSGVDGQTPSERRPSSELAGQTSSVRFATFNVSLNRKSEGALKKELANGDSSDAKRIAEIIQRVRPNVLLLNEFDYDAGGEGISGFLTNYLGVSQNGQAPIQYPFVFFHSVNTGVDSGLDLNADGKLGTPNDAFGFGAFPGQYGMVILSQHEIETAQVRTFQKFLWKDMPGFLWPIDPRTEQPYYDNTIKDLFRLSSKSHWDVPIKVGEKTIHFLAAHPTPPVFDGQEDRNGRRNHDEIRLLADFVSPDSSAYIYDDQGNRGGLKTGAHFVIAGDMNADAQDGDSTRGAAKLLTEHPLINHTRAPKSKGGIYFSKSQGQLNLNHQGDPGLDTGDFNDKNVGNLRIDYCLPSKTLQTVGSGVFWPEPNQPGSDLVGASDHRLVWIDIEK